MARNPRRLTIAIPTWRRPEMLGRILRELARQTRLPDRLIVIDGEGGSRDVRRTLVRSGWPERVQSILVPSTRPNLPFQRWLGRRWCTYSDSLIFFDDDILLPDPETVDLLASALERTAAATCEIRITKSPQNRPRLRTGLIPWLRRARAGKLGHGGYRHPPADGGDALAPVDWLRGGAMAFRCEALPAANFPAALFALADVGLGMGEDIALARCVRGPIALVRGLAVDHPADTPSLACCSRAEHRGFAVAYSRRLLNDLCRCGAPNWGDRAGLAMAWAGGLAAAAFDWARRRDSDRGGYFRGYVRGVSRGALHPPSSDRLTPLVDWEHEARLSLSRAEEIAA